MRVKIISLIVAGMLVGIPCTVVLLLGNIWLFPFLYVWCFVVGWYYSDIKEKVGHICNGIDRGV